MDTQTANSMLAIAAVCEKTDSIPENCFTIPNPVPNYCHNECFGYIVLHNSGFLLGQSDICLKTGKISTHWCSA